VAGSVQRRADRLTDELSRTGRGAPVVPTLLRLASVTGSEEPTRRRIRRATLTSDEQVVDAFVDARLLASDRGPERTDATVEVAHEALLRQWPPLRQAIEADGVGLQRRAELERLAATGSRLSATSPTCCVGSGWPRSAA
jgi:hypothetical protein